MAEMQIMQEHLSALGSFPACKKISPHSNEYGDFLILMPESCDSSVDVAKQRPKGKVISLANNRVTMTGHWKLSSMQKKIPALKRVRGLPYFNA